MSVFDPKDNMGLAVAAGSVLAAGFYIGASTFLSGQSSQLLPVMGSIGIAGIVPAFMSRPGRRRKLEENNQFMHQQVQVLNSHALINVVDNRNCLTEVNDGLLEATGYTREQLIGKPVRTLYDAAGQKLAKQIRVALVRGETWQGETPLRRADGSIFYTQATIKPIVDADGKWIGSISARTDITTTKQLIADHQVAETLHQLREDVWIVDADSETFSYMNGAALRRTGWTAEEFNTKRLSDLTGSSGDG
jgi:PAS domain S-box-containing protein